MKANPIHGHYTAAILWFVAAAIACVGVVTSGRLMFAGSALMFACFGTASVLAARRLG